MRRIKINLADQHAESSSGHEPPRKTALARRKEKTAVIVVVVVGAVAFTAIAGTISTARSKEARAAASASASAAARHENTLTDDQIHELIEASPQSARFYPNAVALIHKIDEGEAQAMYKMLKSSPAGIDYWLMQTLGELDAK